MSTKTGRLALHKPADDGSEYVNVQTDLNQNYDRIDVAVGFQPVPSANRPAAPYPGKPIIETDTGRTYLHNGSTASSGGWLEIPNSGVPFDSDLALAAGRGLVLGDSTAFAVIAAASNAPGDDLLDSRLPADTQPRYLLEVSGAMAWGPGGSSAVDTALHRSSSGTLTVTGNLVVTGTVTSGGGVGQTLFARKTADESVASSTTLQADDHLVVSLAANATYRFEILLISSSSTDGAGDLKVGFAFPTGASCAFSGRGPATTIASGSSGTVEMVARTGAASGTTSISYGLSSTNVGIFLSGTVATGATAGDLRLMWAQDSSNASTTWVLAGSYMVATRVA